MASAWTGSGPVSSPPRALAYGAGAALVLTAFVGLGMGIKAAWRESSAPQLGAAVDAGDTADTLTARPIVELPAAAANNTAEADNSEAAAAENRAEAIQEQTAEAQRVQAQTSKAEPDIDTILASPTEKPTAPAKTTTVEAAPPGPPVKSDVPF